MEVGISTASLFEREKTEGALLKLNNLGVKVCEVFLESYCEYTKKFGKILKKNKGEIDIHSVHTLTTQFEPQLYSVNERAKADSFKFLEETMKVAKLIGAKNYTFHGGARFKKTPFNINYDRVGGITKDITEVCASYGVNLAYENVHWGYYNYVGFFSEIKKRAPLLKGTLDIKQARQSDLFYGDLIKEMGENIITVHLSDVNEQGKMCLPGQGTTDFNDVFNRLKDVGFNGAMLLEVYKNDYETYEELISSLEFVKELAYKIFD